MNKLCYELSVEGKGQLLRHLRAAVFYQIELSNTASSLREILNACQEGDWDTEYRLRQIRPEFGERMVTDHDLETFTANLRNDASEAKAFGASLDERTKSILRSKLQKATWIQNELWKTAGLMAEALAEPAEDFIGDLQEFSVVADSGCELVEADLDFFLGISPSGTVKRGLPLYS